MSSRKSQPPRYGARGEEDGPATTGVAMAERMVNRSVAAETEGTGRRVHGL